MTSKGVLKFQTFSSFGFSVDTDSELHGVEESNDADCSCLHNQVVQDVSKRASIIGSMAAAGVPQSTSSGLQRHHEHADVPWLVNFVNAGATALRFIQVLSAID